MFLSPISDKLVVVAEVFLKLPNLLMLIKQESLSPPMNLVLATFDGLEIVFPVKVSLLFLLNLMVLVIFCI